MTQQEYIEQLEQQVASLKKEVRLTKLRRQVTPHFLFNSLSVATSLVVQSPKTAIRFLSHLAQMYRYLLAYGNEFSVPIEKELKMLRQYYELMSLRHVNCIRMEMSPGVKKLKKHPLPPLTLQGLLENAIKHNAHTEESPLTVYIKEEDGKLVVTNRLAPIFSDTKSTHMGLTYIRETMMQLFQRDIEIINDGESFTVKLPLI